MDGPMEVNSTRFPSGIPALADWLHGKGKDPDRSPDIPALQDGQVVCAGEGLAATVALMQQVLGRVAEDLLMQQACQM